MKFTQILKAACAVVLLSLAAPRVHAVVVYNGTLANETGLAYDTSFSLDLGNSQLPNSNVDQLSMQAAYSSTTFTAATFTDGTAATGTITVSTTNLTTLVGARGSATLYIASNSASALTNSYFTLNSIRFVKDDLWIRAALSTNTAANIASAVNSYGATNGTFLASASGSTVTFTCVSTGTACNSFTLKVSPNSFVVGASTPNSLQINGSTFATTGSFSGGVNHAFFVMAGQTLTESVDWNVVTNATGTAKSISDAIQANATLAAIVGSSWTVAASSFGVVTTTASLAGTTANSYGWFSSKPLVLAMSNLRLYGGTASAITTTSSQITVAANGYTRGLGVLYTKTAGTSPGTLVANTTYFVIPVTANAFKLASSQANAVAGTSVAITTQTLRGGGSFALTPVPYTGTASFKWQVSNDNSSWTDLSVSSVTVTPAIPPTTSIWDFGSLAWRYIRAKVVAPTTGGLYLVITGVGKSN